MKKQFIQKLAITGLLVGFSYFGYSQDFNIQDLNSSNTWLKVGLNTGVPISTTNNSSSFTLGLDVSAQFIRTTVFGIGLKTGYINYFGKDNNDDFGIIPLAAMFRYYPKTSGLFLGLELGYAYVNNLSGLEGGAFVRPSIGYHNDYWNIFGYYDRVIGNDMVDDIQTIGLGLTYNIYFK